MVVLRLHEAAQRHVLVRAMLQEQPALSHDVVVRALEDGAEAVHAAGARIQREPRLEARIAAPEVRVVLRHVGRVADHDVEFLAAHRIEPVALTEFDVGDFLQFRVVARQLQCGERDVDADDLGPRPLARDGQ